MLTILGQLQIYFFYQQHPIRAASTSRPPDLPTSLDLLSLCNSIPSIQLPPHLHRSSLDSKVIPLLDCQPRHFLDIMSVPKSYNIFLKFKPESFKKIDTLRSAGQAWKQANMTKAGGSKFKQPKPYPYRRILAALPEPLLASYRDALAKVASSKAPFAVKTLPAYTVTRRGSAGIQDVRIGLESGPLEALRAQIFSEFKDDLLAHNARYEFKDGGKALGVSTYSAVPTEQAERVVAEIKADGGVNDLIVEALCIQEYTMGVQRGVGPMIDTFPLKG